MTVLTFEPGVQSLEYSFFTSGIRPPFRSGRVAGYREPADGAKILVDALQKIAWQASPDLVAILSPFGGAEFPGPVIATHLALERLSRLVDGDPLHIPSIIELAESCKAAFPRVAVVLVFETAFFARLPSREAGYGISPETSKRLAVRRFGYHGLFHQSAARAARERLHEHALRKRPTRVLSVCLEPQPEVVAIVDGEPVLVTGGSTPLEGLPGETTCGEIDPSIVLELAEKRGWGPELIDYTLTHESGLTALAGGRLTVGDALGVDEYQISPAGRHLRYRILLAAGAALAAMEGLDAFVFSGRYRAAGEHLGPWLERHCLFPGGNLGSKIPWFYLDDPLPRLIANQALSVVSRGRRPAALRSRPQDPFSGED